MPRTSFFLNTRRHARTGLCTLLAWSIPFSAFGALDEPPPPDLFALPLEELLNIQVAIATLEPGSIHEAPGIISVISREEIQHLNPRNITDILNLTPGFNMVVESLHAPLLQLRGTGNRQDNVLLLIDGHRLNSQLFGGSTYIIDDIPVELIDHIEIIRGPGSALYGSNAFEAVINLITVPDKDQKQGLIYTKYGTNDTISGGTIYKSKGEDQHMILAASGADSNGPNDPYVDLSGYHGTIEFPTTSKNIYANAKQGNWNLLALRNVESSGPFIGNTLYLNEGTDREYITSALEGSYSKDLSAFGIISLKAYYDEFDFDCLWEPLPPRLSPPNGFFKNPTATDARLGGEFLWKKTVFTSHRILLGSSYDAIKLYNSSLSQTDPASRQMVEVPASWIIPEENSHYAFFLQDQFPIFAESHITIGARYDNYDQYGDTINPRIGFTTPMSTDSHLKLLYGTAFRAPSYYESNTTAYGNLVPNTDVEPEQLESIEAEYSVQQPQFSWRANTFYTKIKDIIETVTIPAGGSGKRNIGAIDTYGLEAEAKRFFFDNKHSLGINGYLNYAEDDKGDRVLRVPQYGAVLILNNKWSENWNTNIQAKYTGPMEKAPVTAKNGAILAYPADLPATISCNFSVAWSIGKGLTARGLLYNMFDESLYSPAPSRLDSAGDVLADYPYQGRSVMLTLEYAF